MLSDRLCPTPGSPGSRGLARMPEQRSQIFEAANVCAVQEVAKELRAGGKNEWTWFSPKDLQSSPIHITWLHSSSQISKETRAQRGLGIAPDHTAPGVVNKQSHGACLSQTERAGWLCPY